MAAPKRARESNNIDAAAEAKALLESIDTEFESIQVRPGDDVTAIVTRKTRTGLILGDGLLHIPNKRRRSDYSSNSSGRSSDSGRKARDHVRVVKAGTLRYSAPVTYWVENPFCQRYEARTEDCVVGVVEDRAGIGYRMSLYGTKPGILPMLSFEGATQRTKPQLKTGDVVYCRVEDAKGGDLEPLLSCLAICGPRKGWETGEATFGPLGADGMLFQCESLLDASRLKSEHRHPVMEALDKEGVPFEICIGDNGFVWVRAATPPLTIAVANAVQNGMSLAALPDGSEKLVRATIKAMVKDVIDRVRKPE